MKTILEHLEERHLDTTKYPSLFISEEHRKAYFFLYNLSGQIVGYQCYSPELPKRDNRAEEFEKRYYTYLTKPSKDIMLTAFGLDILDPKKRKIFLVEGIFDACRLHSLGLNALALLCSDIGFLEGFLTSLGYELIPVCEGDEAGKKLAKLSTHGECIFLEEGYDLGDMLSEDIEKLFLRFLK